MRRRYASLLSAVNKMTKPREVMSLDVRIAGSFRTGVAILAPLGTSLLTLLLSAES